MPDKNKEGADLRETQGVKLGTQAVKDGAEESDAVRGCDREVCNKVSGNEDTCWRECAECEWDMSMIQHLSRQMLSLVSCRSEIFNSLRIICAQ